MTTNVPAGAAFFDAMRPMFGGSLTQDQVNGLLVILEAWKKVGSGKLRDLAYILATAKHETADTMQPVRETKAPTDAKAKEWLTKAWKAGKLGQVKTPYWNTGFFGRGYVQLTHEDNYRKAGDKLGLDLVADPSKAMIPEIAALILIRGMQEGWFTGKKLSDFPSDFVSSRAVVNGSDRATLIAGYAYGFLQALEKVTETAAATPAPTPPPVIVTQPVGPPTVQTQAPRGNGRFWGALIAIVLALGAGLLKLFGVN